MSQRAKVFGTIALLLSSVLLEIQFVRGCYSLWKEGFQTGLSFFQFGIAVICEVGLLVALPWAAAQGIAKMWATEEPEGEPSDEWESS